MKMGYRIFGGKRYSGGTHYATKGQAKARSKVLRAAGFNVRIMPSGTGSGYAVYFRNPKAKGG